MRHFLNAFIMILNVFIMTGKLYLLNYIGWITLHPAAQIHTLQDSLLTAAAIALVFLPMVCLIWFAYSIFLLATLGLGCLLYPFVSIGAGYATLRMIAAIAPAFLSVTDNLWIGCLTGSILLYLWIPCLSSNKTSPEDGTVGEPLVCVSGQFGKHVPVNMLPLEVANEQKAIAGENGEKTFYDCEL